jgi:hypothetical protein
MGGEEVEEPIAGYDRNRGDHIQGEQPNPHHLSSGDRVMMTDEYRRRRAPATNFDVSSQARASEAP